MPLGLKGFQRGNTIGVKRFCVRGHDTSIVGRDTQAGGNCKECRRIAARQSYYKNGGSYRNCQYRRKFGIVLADYERMLDQQDGKCAGCLRDRSEFKVRLAVDHDHKTGRIRGLLCADCNQALGRLKDSKETLLRLVNYL